MYKKPRSQYIIVRVTEHEKNKLKEQALEMKKQFSNFIRIKLGIDKRWN